MENFIFRAVGVSFQCSLSQAFFKNFANLLGTAILTHLFLMHLFSTPWKRQKRRF